MKLAKSFLSNAQNLFYDPKSNANYAIDSKHRLCIRLTNFDVIEDTTPYTHKYFSDHDTTISNIKSVLSLYSGDKPVSTTTLTKDDFNNALKCADKEYPIYNVNGLLLTTRHYKAIKWLVSKENNPITVEIHLGAFDKQHKIYIKGENFNLVLIAMTKMLDDKQILLPESDFKWEAPTIQSKPKQFRPYKRTKQADHLRYDYLDTGLYILSKGGYFSVKHESSGIELPYCFANTLKETQQYIEILLALDTDWTMPKQELENWYNDPNNEGKGLARILLSVSSGNYVFEKVLESLKRTSSYWQTYNDHDNLWPTT